MNLTTYFTQYLMPCPHKYFNNKTRIIFVERHLETLLDNDIPRDIV